MKTLSRLLVLCTAVTGAALFAQDNTPAATVTSTPPAANVSEPIRVDGLIHVQKLPSPAQITADAEAEGMSVIRMDQQSDRIIVTYRYASGNTRTFAYTTVVPSNPETETVAPASPPSASSPTYSVIYSEPAPVYYYPRYYYDPYWPSTSLSIGLGFGFGRYGYGHFGYGGRYGRWHR